jgi:hypothetical protein
MRCEHTPWLYTVGLTAFDRLGGRLLRRERGEYRNQRNLAQTEPRRLGKRQGVTDPQTGQPLHTFCGISPSQPISRLACLLASSKTTEDQSLASETLRSEPLACHQHRQEGYIHRTTCPGHIPPLNCLRLYQYRASPLHSSSTPSTMPSTSYRRERRINTPLLVRKNI